MTNTINDTILPQYTAREQTTGHGHIRYSTHHDKHHVLSSEIPYTASHVNTDTVHSQQLHREGEEGMERERREEGVGGVGWGG